MPYDKIVFDQWRKEGVLTSLHFCGNSTPVWNDMVETGIHNIEVDQTVDLAEAKGKVIHRACLTGNIGPSAIIRYGTTEDVEKKTRECIQAAGSGGGCVPSPGCVVMPGFPQSNLEKMARVARESGRYS